jgi:hypothetical protein
MIVLLFSKFSYARIEEIVMKETAAKSQDHKVVSVAGDKLTSTCNKGKSHETTVDKDAKVTCDGKASKLSDLKSGTPIRVTTHKDDPKKVTAIESGKHLATAH